MPDQLGRLALLDGVLGPGPATQGIDEEWRDGIVESHAVFVDLVVQAQARGEFTLDEDPMEAATALQIVINGIATLVAQVQVDWPAERQVQMLRKQLIRLGYQPLAASA